MLRAVRIIAYQNMASYRKPTAIAIQDSFKLPPYSTVIGMVHNACGWNSYHPMRVSISGNHVTSISDMYTRYFFGQTLQYEKGYIRQQLYTVNIPGEELGGPVSELKSDGSDKDGKDGIVRGLGYAELIVDVELVLYIVPEDESDLEEIKQGLLYPIKFPSLGRHEDILRIDDVSIVELQQQSGDKKDKNQKFSSEYDCLIPMQEYEKLGLNATGTVYNFNKVFQTVDQTGKPLKYRKITERIKAKLIKKGGQIFYANAWYDELDGKKIGVFLA